MLRLDPLVISMIVAVIQNLQKNRDKIFPKLLLELAKTIILTPDSLYTQNSRDLRDDHFLLQKFTLSWIY